MRWYIEEGQQSFEHDGSPKAWHRVLGVKGSQRVDIQFLYSPLCHHSEQETPSTINQKASIPSGQGETTVM
jgi:hypothetical protein